MMVPRLRVIQIGADSGVDVDGQAAVLILWLVAHRAQLALLPRGKLTLDWSSDGEGTQLVPKLEQSFDRVKVRHR